MGTHHRERRDLPRIRITNGWVENRLSRPSCLGLQSLSARMILLTKASVVLRSKARKAARRSES